MGHNYVKYFLILCAGFIAGTMFANRDAQDRPPLASLPESRKPANEKPASATPTEKKLAPPPSVPVAKKSLETTTVHKESAIPKPAPSRRAREITITSGLIRMLEEDLHQLNRQIQFTREDDGWRVETIQSGSLFSQAGLIEGDLITYNAIEKLRSQERGEEDLPERFVKILSYVTY